MVPVKERWPKLERAYIGGPWPPLGLRLEDPRHAYRRAAASRVSELSAVAHEPLSRIPRVAKRLRDLLNGGAVSVMKQVGNPGALFTIG